MYWLGAFVNFLRILSRQVFRQIAYLSEKK